MNGFALVLVTVALGVDYGWQPSSDGRLEYIIQLEPVTLIALREGQEVLSQIDPYVKDVRRFRIRVGTDLVPRVGSPPLGGDARQDAGATQWAPPAGVTYGWQPVDAQSLEFIVQLSPERMVLLKNGEEIAGEMPAEVRNVSRFRIRSASDPLPRQGLVGSSGLPPNVPPASANQGLPNDWANAGVSATQIPGATGAASPASGAAASAAGSPTSGAINGARQTGPTVAGPPRMTSSAATGTSPAMPPYGQGVDSRYQSPQAPTLGIQTGNVPTQGAATPSQFDPRSIYTPVPGQAGRSGYPTTGSNPEAARGNSWQQSPAQPDNSGGWSATAGNAQNRPPPTRGGVQSAGQAGAGAYSGWDPRSVPSNAYAGTQFNGASPPAQSADRSIPPAGPNYSPFASSGSPSGRSGESSTGTDRTFTPYGQPSSTASQTASEYGSNALSTGSPSQQSGSDLISMASLSGQQRQKAGPMDFWTSLAETVNDPSLAYLRDDGQAPDEEKAWWPLTLAMLALFASMGGNLYMGWIAVDVYRRYLDAATDGYEDDDYRSSNRDDDQQDDWARIEGEDGSR